MYLIKTEKIFPYRIMHISLIFFQWWKIDLSKCKPNSNRLTLVGEKEGERMKLWFKTWLQSSQFFSATHHSQYFIGQVIILGSSITREEISCEWPQYYLLKSLSSIPADISRFAVHRMKWIVYFLLFFIRKHGQ